MNCIFIIANTIYTHNKYIYKLMSEIIKKLEDKNEIHIFQKAWLYNLNKEADGIVNYYNTHWKSNRYVQHLNKEDYCPNNEILWTDNHGHFIVKIANRKLFPNEKDGHIEYKEDKYVAYFHNDLDEDKLVDDFIKTLK